MWRDAVRVVNIEKALERLWDLHDEGVKLLNAHTDFRQNTPDWKVNIGAQDKWVSEWRQKEQDWRKRTMETLTDFAPAEARGLENIVTVELSLSGINKVHTQHLNILRGRLEMFGVILRQHHPRLTPE